MYKLFLYASQLSGLVWGKTGGYAGQCRIMGKGGDSDRVVRQRTAREQDDEAAAHPCDLSGLFICSGEVWNTRLQLYASGPRCTVYLTKRMIFFY